MPVRDLLLIAATAAELAEARPASPAADDGLSGAPVPARSSADELVRDAVRAVMQRALDGLAAADDDGGGTSVNDGGAHIDAIQGIVRALDAAEQPVSNGKALHSFTGEVDTSAAGDPVSGFRQEVWESLQGFATGPPSTPAAAAALVHILDLLSAITRPAGQASRWGEWRPPASAPGAGPDAQHSLLLSCTLAVVGPLWPSPAGDVAALDLADVSVARSLFRRLLEASDSPAQLMALADLLESTWRDGCELQDAAAAVKAEDATASPSERADAANGSTGRSAAAVLAAGGSDYAVGLPGTWVPAVTEASKHVDVPAECPLHDCWAALLEAMVRRGHLAAAVKILDAHAGQPPRLTAAEAHSLAAAAHECAGATPGKPVLASIEGVRHGTEAYPAKVPNSTLAVARASSFHTVPIIRTYGSHRQPWLLIDWHVAILRGARVDMVLAMQALRTLCWLVSCSRTTSSLPLRWKC